MPIHPTIAAGMLELFDRVLLMLSMLARGVARNDAFIEGLKEVLADRPLGGLSLSDPA